MKVLRVGIASIVHIQQLSGSGRLPKGDTQEVTSKAQESRVLPGATSAGLDASRVCRLRVRQ